MCKLKSAIILKDRIFIPEYDSHSEMLEELHITDDYLGASKTFVRAELSPTDNDVFSNIDNWRFVVDQDITPEWFSVEEYKPKMIEAVKKWAETHIHIGVRGLKVEGGKNHYIKDCKDVVISNSTVEAWGNSTVEALGNSTVKAWDNSTVKALGNSTVKALGNSTVEAWGNSTVKALGNSTVEAWGNSTVKALGNSTVEALGNSTVEALGNSTVKALGNSTVKAWDNSTVEAWGNSTVKALGNSTVKAWDNSTVEAWGNSTVVNDDFWTWYKQNTLILADNATFKDKKAKVIYQSGNYKLISVESGTTIGATK